MKGAPEKIIDKCATILINGQTIEIDDKMRKRCDQECFNLAGRGG